MTRGSFITVGTACLLLALGTPAIAGVGDGKERSGASTNGDSGSVWVHQSRPTYEGDTGDGGGSDTAAQLPPDYEPPPCWYVPASQAALKRYVHRRSSYMGYHIPEATPEQFYKAFDFHKDDKGQWYAIECSDPGSDAAIAWQNSHDPFRWTPQGQGPPQDAVDPQMLARMARAQMHFATPDIRVNPAERSYVGLSTWVWLAQGAPREREVTASLAGISSTLTASVDHIEIEPGTSHAKVWSCDGDGHPYTDGADWPKDKAPCGVTYTHASTAPDDQSYDLTATLVWNLEWTSSTGSGGQLTDVTVSETVEIRVAEIQTKVTG